MSSFSIRDKQIDILKFMLNFNQPYNATSSSLNEPSWKILVYDEFGQDIISPLLSVKELRDLGVTAHLLLKSEKDPIPDVPAIYFISPTAENVNRLCQDLKNELYESYYLNFISPIPRALLEDIAQAAITSNTVHSIAKVFDQYLNFISLDDELFCLKHHNRDTVSYYSLNRNSVSDTEMIDMINTIADGLFSVFVSLGSIPIIRCPKLDSAAAMVAEKLDKKIRENLRDTRNSLFANDALVTSMSAANLTSLSGTTGASSQMSFQRPLLVLLDRSFDLATPLHHTWTYQALLHDVFDINLNRIELPSASAAASVATATKKYDLLATDRFWKEQKGQPFPEVAEHIQEELDKFKQCENEIKNLKDSIEGDAKGQNEEAMSLLFNNTSKLTTAISSLPELTEMKRLLDMHTNLATSLLDQIKKRKLDIYFETEEKLISKATLEKSIMEMINDPEAGSPQDKLRMFIIYYLCNANLSPGELDQYLIQLKEAGCDIDCVKYIKRYKAISKMSSYSGQTQSASLSSAAAIDFSSATVNKLSTFLSKSSKFMMEGVKNFVLKQNRFPITRITENLMEMKSSSETDDYKYFDPKLIKNDGIRPKTAFNDAIVFVIGGGNYIEYQNLMDYAKSKTTPVSTKRIIYGSTELLNASVLLKEFSKLGKET